MFVCFFLESLVPVKERNDLCSCLQKNLSTLLTTSAWILLALKLYIWCRSICLSKFIFTIFIRIPSFVFQFSMCFFNNRSHQGLLFLRFGFCFLLRLNLFFVLFLCFFNTWFSKFYPMFMSIHLSTSILNIFQARIEMKWKFFVFL